MIEKLYHHINGGIQPGTVTVDRPYQHGIRCQIFVRHQDEHDYLSALNLMYGRDIEIHIWDDWRNTRRMVLETSGPRMKVLPYAYTTWHCNLRGF